jgi:hypothetical protein
VAQDPEEHQPGEDVPRRSAASATHVPEEWTMIFIWALAFIIGWWLIWKLIVKPFLWTISRPGMPGDRHGRRRR